MHNQITHSLIWTSVFIFTILRVNKKLGQLNEKIYYAHVFLSWFLLMFYDSSIQVLSWASRHMGNIPDYLFIPIGPLPAWFNLFSWIGNLFCGVIAMIAAFALAKRIETARVWLLRLMPMFYLFAVTKGMKAAYKGKEAGHSLSSVIFICALVYAIPFGEIYLFYRSDGVKKYIFCKSDETPL